MLLQLKPDVVVENDEDNGRIVKSPLVQLTLKGLSPTVGHALSKLMLPSSDEKDLINEVREAEGESSAASFYYYLDLLERHGLLIYRTPLIELVPLNTSFSRENRPLVGPFRLSRFALCRLEKEELVIETPLAPVQVTIKDKEGLSFFYGLRKSSTFQELLDQFSHISPDVLEESLALLYAARILTSDGESDSMTQWEFHDLFFHSRSRLGRHNHPFGGTYRFKGSIPQEPSIKQCPKKPFTMLAPPVADADHRYGHVLGSRKSIRKHGEQPIALQQLSEFLFHCARVKGVEMVDGQELSSRPYPGGGGRYELELYPVIHSCKGLSQGVYHYHPLEHGLCKVSSMNDEVEKLLKDACRASGKDEYPQILIVISSRFQRISWKYQSMAYATILKDVGVLIQTMYLTATSMGLAPCAVGGGDSDLFCKLIGTEYLEETSVGEFMLGSRTNP